MNTGIEMSAAEAAYAEAAATGTERSEADWLQSARELARSRVRENGLPHRRLESWRWTDLRSMLDGAFPPRLASGDTDVAALAADPFAACERYLVVIADGRVRKDLSDLGDLSDNVDLVFLGDGAGDMPDWLRHKLGESYGPDDDRVFALNTAFFSDGIALRVHEGAKLKKPLEVRLCNTGQAPETISTRIVVSVGAGADLTLLESHSGPEAARYVANNVLEVDVADGARLSHVKLQDESLDAVHLGTVRATIGADAEYRNFTFSLGARVARNQFFAKLAGEGGNLDATGAYLLNGKQHCDTALQVDHAVANCNSNELFKCVMDEQARGIFQGKIIVRPDAQKTDGMQMSQGLLLSETAEFDAKPELEIFADDVRCTHGATSGELDEDLMFYLRSRGIPKAEAKALLIAAFVGEAIAQVEDEAMRDILNEIAHGWVGGRK